MFRHGCPPFRTLALGSGISALCCFLVLGAITGKAVAADEYPRAPMPERVAQLLLEANRDAVLTNTVTHFAAFGSNIRQSKATNEAVLKILNRAFWPDLSQFKRVRCRKTVTRSGDTNVFRSYWAFYGESKEPILLNDSFSRELYVGELKDIQNADYGAELAAIIESLRAGHYGDTNRADRSPEVMALLRHSIAAAWVGYTNQARELTEQMVNNNNASEALWISIEISARRSLETGLTKLRSGGPRSEVLKQWEETLRIYGPTLASTQLVDYITQTKKQLEEFPKLIASTVENPGSLPPAQRAEYFADRLQDVQRMFHGEKTVEDEILALNRDAIPALISHLRDRRLARLTCPYDRFSFSYENNRMVLRVQDLAVSLLERMTKLRFVEAGKPWGVTPLSARDKIEREKIAGSIETWWRADANNSSLQWRLARLNSLSLGERLTELAELERLDPKATNYLKLLRAWAKERDAYRANDMIRALTTHGDFSFVPYLRENWQRGRFGDVEFLLKYGNAEDYGLLRDSERKRQLEHPDPNYSLYAFRITSMLGDFSQETQATTNLLLVPLLVDVLSYRMPNQSSYVNGRPVKYSHADAAMKALIGLTQHNEDYDPLAEVETRNTAIDRWQKWWTHTGEQQWLALHPETRPAFGMALSPGPVQLDLKNLSELVRIFPADRELPVIYEAPRQQIPTLVRRGAVAVKQFAGVTQMRFKSPAVEAQWFTHAKAEVFTNTSYTSQVNQARLVVRRPGRTANAFLYPAMRLESVDLALPDTRGRTWAAWHGSSCSRVSRFEGGQWKTVFTNISDTYSGTSRGFRFAFPIGEGAMILVDTSNNRLHLFDGKEHLEFPNIETLVQHEAKRLHKLLSFPAEPREHGIGPNLLFSLCKDREGNIWWAALGQLGVVSDGHNFLLPRQQFAPDKQLAQVMWLNPLPKGAGVIAADYRSARVFRFGGKSVKSEAQVELPTPSLTGTGITWPRFLPQRDGSFWVSARESLAFDASLRRIGSQAGPLLLRDSQGAVWFVDYNHSLDIGLIRLAKDGVKSTLRLRGISGPPADNGDGSIWAQTTEGVVRVGPRGGKLEVIEEAAVPNSNYSRMWRDEDDRLWIMPGDYYDSGPFKIAAYVTRH